MGISISLVGHPPERGFFKPTRIGGGALARSMVDDVLSQTEFAPFCTDLDRQDGGACIVLPIEEPVEFTDHGENVSVTARTSSCGPGYHAFLVEQLDQLAELHDFEWHEQSYDDESYEDESEYYSVRSFGRLQEKMGVLLRQIARLVQDQEGDCLLVQLPIDWGIDGREGHIATPRGYITNVFMDEVATTDDESLANYAAAYYPWWDEGLTDSAREGISDALLWCEFPWRSPLSNEERRLGLGIRGLLRGRTVSTQPRNLSKETQEELDLILDAEDEVVWPQIEGIGYNRGYKNWWLTGGWVIRGPGYGVFYFDEDDGCVTIDFRGGRILATTLRLDRKDEFVAEEKISGEKGDVCQALDGFAYVANHEPYTSDDFEGYWLSGSVDSSAGLAVISILYEEPQFSKVAEEMFMSTHVPTEPPVNVAPIDEDE